VAGSFPKLVGLGRLEIPPCQGTAALSAYADADSIFEVYADSLRLKKRG